MTDNTELQRLTRLRRLSRQIAASLPADIDFEQAFQMHGGSCPHLDPGGRPRRARRCFDRSWRWRWRTTAARLHSAHLPPRRSPIVLMTYHRLMMTSWMRTQCRGSERRAIQAWMGHKNIQHTVRYAELASDRSRDIWRGYCRHPRGCSTWALRQQSWPQRARPN
jgi:hypothetical protein